MWRSIFTDSSSISPQEQSFSPLQSIGISVLKVGKQLSDMQLSPFSKHNLLRTYQVSHALAWCTSPFWLEFQCTILTRSWDTTKLAVSSEPRLESDAFRCFGKAMTSYFHSLLGRLCSHCTSTWSYRTSMFLDLKNPFLGLVHLHCRRRSKAERHTLHEPFLDLPRWTTSTRGLLHIFTA